MDQPPKKIDIACGTCRKRKRKCDGIRPACTSCTARGISCEYPDVESLRKRKQASVDYVAHLEETVELLTARVAELSRISNNSEQPNTQSIETSTLMSHDSNAEERLPAALNDISAMVWKMNLGPDGMPQFIGPSGNHTLEFLSSQSNDQTDTRREAEADLLHASADPALKQEFFAHFMKNVNTYHQLVPTPLISENKIDPAMRADYDLLLNAIYAAGSCFSRRYNAQAVGLVFMKAVESNALRTCRETPSLWTVQALSIIAWYHLACGHDNLSWVYLNTASAIILQFGLHVTDLKNMNRVQNKDIAPVKSNLRTIWSFVLLDRIITSLLGRHCTIPWKRLKAQSFLEVLDNSANLEEIVFAHQCKLWYIHDVYMDQMSVKPLYGYASLTGQKRYDFEYPNLDLNSRSKLLVDARQALFQFHRSVDTRLQGDMKQKPSSVIVFHMSYQCSILLIHRPYLREDPLTSIYRLALHSMTAAASSITRLVRAHRKLGTLAEAPPFVAHHILTASMMHLLNTTSTNAELRQQSIGRFRMCISGLEDLSTHWQRASEAIQALRSMAHRWGAVHALPMHLSGALPSEEADTLVDSAVVEGLGNEDNDTSPVEFEEPQQYPEFDLWSIKLPEDSEFLNFVDYDAAMDFSAYFNSDLFTYQ